jgi:ribose 1,5-bisphosphokinase
MIAVRSRSASAPIWSASASPGIFRWSARSAIGQGVYAFWWEAHGLKYALSAAIDAELRSGKTVVCNVSRAVVRRLRERYDCVTVVLVTAPKEVLLARLAARGRESAGDVTERLDRAAGGDLAPDIVIENIGDPHDGARRLAEVLRGEAR